MFFKQDGKIALSHSDNLKNWSFEGFVEGGENPCVITKDNFYYIIYSPNDDGIGFKRSQDLKTWEDMGVTLLQKEKWQIALGRVYSPLFSFITYFCFSCLNKRQLQFWFVCALQLVLVCLTQICLLFTVQTSTRSKCRLLAHLQIPSVFCVTAR